MADTNEREVFTPRTVLALGGGGMRGMAHIGAWLALREAGVRVDAIVGTSIGSLIGALAAAGMTGEEMRRVALEIRREDVLKMNRRVAWIGGIRQPALCSDEHFRGFLHELLPVDRFESLSMPFRLNAVSLLTGEETWMGTGRPTPLSLDAAVYASCALPPYFPPLYGAGDVLVDGGLHTALPAQHALAWASERIIAIDVGGDLLPLPASELGQGMLDIRARVGGIVSAAARQRTIEDLRDEPVLYVHPHVSDVEMFDFDHTDTLIDRGYDAVRRALESTPN